MEVVRVDGLEVSYRRAGRGPPVVLAHGAAGDSRSWQPQIEGLADEFTVIAWDEPGAGASSDLPARFGFADYARCLGALVDSLGVGPVHLGGLSWGGMVALELQRLRPELVVTLILADTYAGWKGSLPEEERRARVEGLRRMLAAPAGSFDPTFPGLFAAGPPPQFAALLDEMAADVRRQSMAVLLGMADLDLRDRLPGVSVPALLIWGEEDARSPLRVAREFEAAIPGGELVLIPGAGHMSNLERPEAFNDAVRGFCRRHPPPPHAQGSYGPPYREV
jgi:pimeloyl-ACP methyl ester carboxylesterase